MKRTAGLYELTLDRDVPVAYFIILSNVGCNYNNSSPSLLEKIVKIDEGSSYGCNYYIHVAYDLKKGEKISFASNGGEMLCFLPSDEEWN